MGDGSYLCFVRHTEIHAPVRRRHCIIHFQQSVRFVAVYLRDQRRGLSARLIELTIAALLTAGAFIPILSALGSLMGIGTFAITWSFFFSTPGVVKWSVSTDPIAWNLTGEFLYKDVVLLCVCIVLFLASLPKKVVPLRSN